MSRTSTLLALSASLLFSVSSSQHAIAVPKAAAPAEASESSEGAESADPDAVLIDDPTAQDTSPTLELPATEAVVTAEQPTGPDLADDLQEVALKPKGSPESERCVVEIALPADGEAASEPDEPATEGEEETASVCVDMVDADTTVVTPDGLQPLSSQPGQGSTETILLERLAERRSALEKQEQVMDMQASLLKAAERNLEKRAEELAAVEANIRSLVDKRDEQKSEQISELVALYQTMEPEDAAAVLDGLPDPMLLSIASGMTSRKLAAIMEEMTPQAARSLTVLMLEGL